MDRTSHRVRDPRLQCFPNPDGVFTPGMFARVRVPGSPSYAALLLPDSAIGSEQVRKFVCVAGSEKASRAEVC